MLLIREYSRVKMIINKGRSKGFALIEILVSLTVLTIIVVAFTGLLTHSFSAIFEAGKKSDALYEAQDNLENKIALRDFGTGQKIDLDFGSTYTVWGKRIDETKYTTFVSDSSERIRFVAVGGNGIITGSADGSNWDVYTSNTADHLYGVTWGGAFGERKYVAVGAGGTVVTSPDGINLVWHKETTSTLNDLHAITWGGPEGDKKYVIVGDEIILFSEDGKDWGDIVDVEEGLNLFDITWVEKEGLGMFVAVGDNGKIVTSSDGTSWVANYPVNMESEETPDLNNIDLNAVTWDGNKIVAIGNTPESIVAIYTTNGADWFIKNYEHDYEYEVKDIIWGGKVNSSFLVVGQDGFLNLSIDDTIVINPIESSSFINCITWGYNQFTAVDNDGDVFTSLDAKDWSQKLVVDEPLYSIVNADIG